MQETAEDFEKRGLQACHFGHVGDGNVHTLALFDDEEELARVRVAVHDMVERAISLGGTCSGEHGVGLGKIEYLPRELGDGTVNLMETVKVSLVNIATDAATEQKPDSPQRTIDPNCLMNPGKIYPNIRPQGGNPVKEKKFEDFPQKPHQH